MAAQKKTKGQASKRPTPKQDGRKPAQITIKKLHSTYGPHAVSILREHLEQLPRERKRGAVRTYKIVKPLPAVEMFLELRKKRFTSSADALVDEAFSAFEELISELQEWYDNLPEAFQSGDKGSQIEEAIGALENINRLDVPESVADLEIFYLPPEKIVSRPDRRDDSVSRLHAVVDAINEHLQENPESDDAKEIEDFAGELEDAISEAENVEFPGMYG